MCFSERSILWLFSISPLRKKNPKHKTEVNVCSLLIELLGIIYSNKHLKKYIDVKACRNASYPLGTSVYNFQNLLVIFLIILKIRSS